MPKLNRSHYMLIRHLAADRTRLGRDLIAVAELREIFLREDCASRVTLAQMQRLLDHVRRWRPNWFLPGEQLTDTTPRRHSRRRSVGVVEHIDVRKKPD